MLVSTSATGPALPWKRKAAPIPGLRVKINLIDLPGTYSLDVGLGHTALDEKIARDFVLANNAELYINIIDASNIERNLYLTTQLLEMNRPMLVVLNMIDVARDKQVFIEVAELSARLGCPVIPVSASQNYGIDKLRDAIDRHLASADEAQTQAQRLVTVTYPDAIEKCVDQPLLPRCK